MKDLKPTICHNLNISRAQEDQKKKCELVYNDLMSDAWKQWDFSGAGLQSLNLELTKRKRRLGLTYGLWLLFAIGAHNLYLREHRQASAYVALTILVISSFMFRFQVAAIALGAIEGIMALIDLATLDKRVTAANKKLRIALSLQSHTTPPADYKGRYTDDVHDLTDYFAIKEQEQAGHSTRPLPGATPLRHKTASFQAQEAALRAHNARKSPKNRQS